MARAKKQKPKRKAETDMEKRLEDFSEEMEGLGKRFSGRMERKKWDAGCCGSDVFGIVGPFLSSVLGIVMVAILTWVLSIVNSAVGSGLITNIRYFLLSSMGWFFLIFLFFSYASYFSKKAGEARVIISPIVTAAGITVALWIIAGVIRVANASLSAPALLYFSSFIEANLWLFLAIFATIGYVAAFIGLAMKRANGARASEKHHAPAARGHMIKGRLYRSGRERILGGVCGGIAEHLGVDPVIIRLLWIAACLAWGFGIIFYLICWIVIPRNPRDKWD